MYHIIKQLRDNAKLDNKLRGSYITAYDFVTQRLHWEFGPTLFLLHQYNKNDSGYDLDVKNYIRRILSFEDLPIEINKLEYVIKRCTDWLDEQNTFYLYEPALTYLKSCLNYQRDIENNKDMNVRINYIRKCREILSNHSENNVNDEPATYFVNNILIHEETYINIEQLKTRTKY